MSPIFLPLTPLAILGSALFSLGLLVACITDVRSRRIPNWLVAAVAAAGLLYSVAAQPSLGGLGRSAAGIATGLLLWIPLYAMGWLGAGDVKLFAAAGAWLGPARALEASLVAALAGGLLSLVWMLRVHGLHRTAAVASYVTAAPRRFIASGLDTQSDRAIPYGIALSIGALVAAWWPAVLWSTHA